MLKLRFTLYSRSYCHLCHDMLEHLRAELNDVEHTIEVIDIDLDGNEELLEQYDELVPVLYAIDTHGQAHQLCHYFLDRDKLTAYRLAQS